MNAPQAARELARHGRYGDTHLLHVNEAELAGLAALAGGSLPVNPVTGLPEAFFFLPFLAGLFGAAAPAAAGTAAAMGGATAAGMAAAAPAMAAAAPEALAATGALGAGLNAGIGAAAGLPALGSGAQAAGQAAASIPQAAQTAGLGSLGVDPMTTGSVTPMGSFGSSHGLGPSMTFKPFEVNAPILNNPVMKPNAAPNMLGGKVGSSIADSTITGSGEAGTRMGGLGGLLGKMDMSQMLPLALMAQGLGGGGGSSGGGGGGKVKVPKRYKGPDAVFPDDDYRGGIDDEWDYFPDFRNGGLVKGYAQGGPVQATIYPNQEQAGLQALSPSPMQADNLMGDIPPAQMDSPYAQQPQQQGGGPNDEALIEAAVQAILGQSPNPDQVLMEFVKVFGEEALQDLVMRVKGMGQQQSDGMSDSVPAMVDGQQPAALSQGEYVVPADVVSGLGNGSSDAGAQQLDQMSGRVRTMRGGGPVQPPALNPMRMMPR